MIDYTKLPIVGHVLIREVNTNKILVDKFNSINFENFSIALARSISNRSDGWIYQMVFGNGAATVGGTGTITYLSPNIIGQGAQLYNETFNKIVDDQSSDNTDPANNYITIAHAASTTYTDVIIKCTLNLGEPVGQDAFDNSTSLTSNYVFNELGLKAYGGISTPAGSLLTHVIFSPVTKSLNRIIEVVYTIRIQTV